jgi:hypothetical protein
LWTRAAGNGNTVTGITTEIITSSGPMAATTANSPFPTSAPALTRLHAFADGVLGEFAQANITVDGGQVAGLGQNRMEARALRQTNLGDWLSRPHRRKILQGRRRNYWLWGWYVRYGALFPNDITYTIGKSDYHKDWFFEQVPHAKPRVENPAAKDPANQRFRLDENRTPGEDMWRTIGQGRATTWTIKFNMDKASQGQATLRVALAGSDGNGGLAVAVNGQSVGTIRFISTNALRYNTDKGGPSPKTFHGRVPKMHSLFTSIQPAMPLSTASSLSSIVPSPRTGMFSSRLPFLLTMSHSILMTVFALL